MVDDDHAMKHGLLAKALGGLSSKQVNAWVPWNSKAACVAGTETSRHQIQAAQRLDQAKLRANEADRSKTAIRLGRIQKLKSCPIKYTAQRSFNSPW